MPNKIELSKPKNYFHSIIITKKKGKFSIMLSLAICIYLFFAPIGINGFFKELIFISSFFVAIYNVWSVKIGLDMQFTQNKIQNSFSFIREYDKLTNYIHEEDPINFHLDNKVLLEIDYNNLTDKYSLYNSIKKRFNYFEELSIAIQCGYIEEEVAFKTLKGILIRHYNLYFVEKTYKYMNLKESEFSYLNAEILYNSWKDSKSLITKKVIPCNIIVNC